MAGRSKQTKQKHQTMSGNATSSPRLPLPPPRPRAHVTQVVSSCDETLLLTSRGEVLVCRNVSPKRIKRGKTMQRILPILQCSSPPNDIHVAKMTNYGNTMSSTATLVCCQCDVKSTTEHSCVHCERCNRPRSSMATIMNGGHTNYTTTHNNSHNFKIHGGIKTRHKQYDWNNDYHFTNFNNGDRRFGGSYDDAHDDSGHGKKNNHAAVLSSSSWPGMDRAVDVHDEQVVDELSDLIGVSLNGYGGGNSSSSSGGGDDVEEERNLSPTPLMSFDYNGYEPPTPVSGNIFLYDEDGGNDDDSHHTKDYTTITTILQTTKDNVSSKLDDDNIFAYLPGSGCCSIPTYLHQLSQIVITKISAHPQGHHVLLISAEGLLFSYGSNRYGQLGIGNQQQQTQQQQIQTTTNDRNTNDNNETTKTITDTNHGQRKSTTILMQQQSSNTDYSYNQHSIPTIVTPLLENGGKTINCAAGVDYSLVVVKTECIRIKYQSPKRHQQQQQQQQEQQHHNRTQTSHHHHRTVATSAQQEQQHEYHHQMYGFGNNHDRKLGLLDPDRAGSSSSSSQHHRSTIASKRISTLLPGSPNSIGSLGDVSCNTEDTTGSSSGNCYNNNTTAISTTFDKFANYVFLPRRVALHCRVKHEKQQQQQQQKQPKSFTSSVSTSLTEAVEIDSSSSKFPPYGIFSIAASVEHSSALLKRPSGDIEIYTWGGGGIINMSLLPTTTAT